MKILMKYTRFTTTGHRIAQSPQTMSPVPSEFSAAVRSRYGDMKGAQRHLTTIIAPILRGIIVRAIPMCGARVVAARRQPF
jgi:hypothetical protein